MQQPLTNNFNLTWLLLVLFLLFGSAKAQSPFNDDSDDDFNRVSKLATGVIVAIIVAVIVGLIIKVVIVVLVYRYYQRRRRERQVYVVDAPYGYPQQFVPVVVQRGNGNNYQHGDGNGMRAV